MRSIRLPTFVFKKIGHLPLKAEALRSMALATASVFARHNLYPKKNKVTIRWHGVRLLDEYGKPVGGLASPDEAIMDVYVLGDPDAVLTVTIHEYIHLVLDFPAHTDEKNTSTLVCKVKPEITQHMLLHLDNYYKVAAFLAHTKPGMAYEAKNGDHYDERQYIACLTAEQCEKIRAKKVILPRRSSV